MSLIKNSFTERLKFFLQKYEVSSFIFAYSGGVDSSVLLDVLMKIKEEMQFHFVVCYFNHRIRPEHITNQEVLFVREKLLKARLEFFICSIENMNIIASAIENNTSLEEEAREKRILLFNSLKWAKSMDFIMFAQHKNDDEETIIMRLFSYSSEEALCGIKEKNGIFLRPLLCFSKEEILEYARENAISFFQDDTNFKPLHLRNKVRLNILPMIKNAFPSYQKSIEKIKKHASVTRKKFEFIFVKKTEFITFYNVETKKLLALKKREIAKNILMAYCKLQKEANHAFERLKKRFPKETLKIIIKKIIENKNSNVFEGMGITLTMHNEHVFMFLQRDLGERNFCFKIERDCTIDFFGKKIEIREIKAPIEGDENSCIQLDYPFFIKNRIPGNNTKKILQSHSIRAPFRNFVPMIYRKNINICILLSLFNLKNIIYYNNINTSKKLLHFCIK